MEIQYPLFLDGKPIRQTIFHINKYTQSTFGE
jgi:hypothetical protein